MKPKVLIATTCHWFSSARLSMALTNAGFLVEAICPPYHPLRKISVVHKVYTYQGLTPQMSFADAIASSNPDLILPGDDLATRHLQELYAREKCKSNQTSPVGSLIERSIGDARSYPVMFSRSAFIHLAEEENIRVPKMDAIKNRADLESWIDRFGLPAVLKSNGSSGGEGVRIVRNPEDAQREFARLHAPPLLARAAKHVLIDHDMTLVWPSLLRRHSTVNAQQFVAGHEATSLIACWKGAVLGGLHFEVINKSEASGPATVMRWIENEEMQTGCAKIARRLNLSGLHGFDFMLEDGTGHPYMIEWNPRATQVGHLTLGLGRDLPAGLFSAVTGTPIQEAPALTENDTITLFPQEWLRNSTSPYLESGYHDVPWQEPELIRECVRKPRKWKDFYSQKKLAQVFSEVRLPRL